MFVNPVDLRHNQYRQLQAMRIRAEQQAPDSYASELAGARWQIENLTKKLEDERRINSELEAEIAFLKLQMNSSIMVKASQFI